MLNQPNFSMSSHILQGPYSIFLIRV